MDGGAVRVCRLRCLSFLREKNSPVKSRFDGTQENSESVRQPGPARHLNPEETYERGEGKRAIVSFFSPN